MHSLTAGLLTAVLAATNVQAGGYGYGYDAGSLCNGRPALVCREDTLLCEMRENYATATPFCSQYIGLKDVTRTETVTPTL